MAEAYKGGASGSDDSGNDTDDDEKESEDEKEYETSEVNFFFFKKIKMQTFKKNGLKKECQFSTTLTFKLTYVTETILLAAI